MGRALIACASNSIGFDVSYGEMREAVKEAHDALYGGGDDDFDD